MLQRADASVDGLVTCPGVDRVLWLRVRLRDGRLCDGVVHGVRHRRPVDVRVGVDVVRRLLRTGIPTVQVDG